MISSTFHVYCNYNYYACFAGLAVDWINSKLYWTDEERGHIMVTQLDGNFPHVLMDHVNNPRGIEVDPDSGYALYSLALGNRTKIIK